MRKFPLSASFTALCSATLVCALVVCCSIFGLSSSKSGNENIVSISESDAEIETVEMEETIFNGYFENI